MTLLHIVVLALVQGITEFLPISSSAHLILVPHVFGWPDQGVLLDVAVHVGTLFAVMLYFWRDMLCMAVGLKKLVLRQWDFDAKLVVFVAIGTIPIVCAGFFLNLIYPAGLRGLELIAWANIGFGVLLWVSDRYWPRSRAIEGLRLRDAIIVGLFQVLALIPGTSRAGITMTAARFLGFDRVDGARFSLLLSIPTILAAGTLTGLKLAEAGDVALTTQALIAAVLAFFAALAAIAAMMAWLRHAGFGPFVVYRLILGVILLAVTYGIAG